LKSGSCAAFLTIKEKTETHSTDSLMLSRGAMNFIHHPGNSQTAVSKPAIRVSSQFALLKAVKDGLNNVKSISFWEILQSCTEGLAEHSYQLCAVAAGLNGSLEREILHL